MSEQGPPAREDFHWSDYRPSVLVRAQDLAIEILTTKGSQFPQALINQMRATWLQLSESDAIHAIWRLNNDRQVWMSGSGRLQARPKPREEERQTDKQRAPHLEEPDGQPRMGRDQS